MNARQLKLGRALLGLLGGATLCMLAASATAAVTGSLVAGSTCPGTSSAAYTPGGATQTVTLCISTDVPVCGGTYILKSAAAGEDDRFRVTARALLGTIMTDPTTTSPAFPVSIVSTGTIDFGGTSGTATSQPAVANLAVATFTIAPQASATNGSYVISLLNSGMTSTSTDCVSPASFSDNAIAASFTFFQPPTATIAVSPSSVPDNGAALTYTVTLAPPPASTTPVSVTSSVTGTMSGVANTCSGTVSVSTGGTGTCTIAATNTVPFDGPATATVNVVAGAGYVLGSPISASGTITNDDLPTVSIAAAPASIFDSAGAGNTSTVTVTMNLAAPAGGFTVNLTPPPTPNARYTTTCGASLLIAAGSTTATCTVTATPNTTAGDGSQPAPVAIAASGTYTITGTNPAVVTIQDDDIPVVSAVCTPGTLTDSAGQVSTCTISSDKALGAALTVNLNPPASNPTRYGTTCASTIILPIGGAGTSNTCTITAVANTTLGDGNVTATLSVAAGTGYTVGGSTQNVAVNNDDFATITVAVSPSTVSESSGTAMVYTFTASAAQPTAATSILFTPPAASGRYTTTCVSPIVLGATATTVTCSVTPINNATLDGSVTATVTLLPSAGVYTVGSPSVATGTITDDDVGIGVTSTPGSVIEGGAAVFTIACSGTGSSPLTYTFSGSYTPLPTTPTGGTVTCGTPLVVSVPTVDDTLINGSRTLQLCIAIPQQIMVAPGSGLKGRVAGKVLVVDPAQQCATVVILDNDRPTIIPTMSTLGLLLLGLLLAAAAGFGIRRKA